MLKLCKGVLSMQIVGLDLGYTYTKSSNMDIFPSLCTKTEPLLGGKSVAFDGEIYYVGDGTGTIDLNKVDAEVTKACLFYALSLIPDKDIYLVTGLPISQYRTQEQDFKNMILDSRYKAVTADGKSKLICVNDVIVFPQGAGALYSQDINSDAIVIDVGGRTVDIAYFELNKGKRKLEKSGTLYNGMLSLYTDIIAHVNTKYELSLPPKYAEHILLNGLTIDGEPQDISFLAPTIAEHVDKICGEVKVNYPYKTTDIYLCGGGGEILHKAFERRFKGITLMENSQFANAIGFKKVGETIWRRA